MTERGADGGPRLDEYLRAEVPQQFLFGALEDDGSVFTLSAGPADQPVEGRYQKRIAILARLVVGLEPNTHKSPEEAFRALIEKRNESRDNWGGSA